MRTLPKLALITTLATMPAFAQTADPSRGSGMVNPPVVTTNPAPNAADRSDWAGSSTGGGAAPDAFRPQSGTRVQPDWRVAISADQRWRCEQLTSNDRLACLDQHGRRY